MDAKKMKAACIALIRAGGIDGRYVALCQQTEWTEAMKLSEDAGLSWEDVRFEWQLHGSSRHLQSPIQKGIP